MAMPAAQRLKAELGYALDGLKGRALWMPYLGAEAGEGDSSVLRMGIKLSSGPHLEAGLELVRGAPVRNLDGDLQRAGDTAGASSLHHASGRSSGEAHTAVQLHWALRW